MLVADYTLYDLAQLINQEHQQCLSTFKATLEHARQTGAYLLMARSQVKHGEWLNWVQENCQISIRQTQKYLRIAENWSAIEASSEAHLTIDQALKLIASSSDEPDQQSLDLDAEPVHVLDHVLDREQTVNRPQVDEPEYDPKPYSNSVILPSNQGKKNGGTDENTTPEIIWRAAQNYFGGVIDLDPCSDSLDFPNIEATNYYTTADDGLSKPWIGNVWCNPPYSETGDWVAKGVEEIGLGNAKSIIYLVKNDNRTSWYAQLMDLMTAFCIYRGYVRFGDAECVAPFGSILFLLDSKDGDDTFICSSRFNAHFHELGWCF